MTDPSRVSFEQAVYGSFPFWDQGYALLASSPGCRPEWLEEFQAACRRYGEPTRDASGHGSDVLVAIGQRAMVDRAG